MGRGDDYPVLVPLDRELEPYTGGEAVMSKPGFRSRAFRSLLCTVPRLRPARYESGAPPRVHDASADPSGSTLSFDIIHYWHLLLMQLLTRSLSWIATGLVCVLAGACANSSDEPGRSALDSSNPAPVNSLTEAERAEGWKLLFDGTSFEGWRGLGRDDVPGGHWTIQDGVLHKVASSDVPSGAGEGGDIMTVDTYDDFELSFEWKTTQEGNSGIKYNVSEEMSTTGEPPYGALGFEYQLLDDEGHPAADHASKNTTAALYDLVASRPPGEKQLKPVGEWNRSRIVVNGNRGEHWLNGQKQLEYELNTEQFDSLVEASKFSDIDGFATKRAGHIVLQDHSTPAWFRNIKIREL